MSHRIPIIPRFPTGISTALVAAVLLASGCGGGDSQRTEALVDARASESLLCSQPCHVADLRRVTGGIYWFRMVYADGERVCILVDVPRVRFPLRYGHATGFTLTPCSE